DCFAKTVVLAREFRGPGVLEGAVQRGARFRGLLLREHDVGLLHEHPDPARTVRSIERTGDGLFGEVVTPECEVRAGEARGRIVIFGDLSFALLEHRDGALGLAEREVRFETMRVPHPAALGGVAARFLFEKLYPLERESFGFGRIGLSEDADQG